MADPVHISNPMQALKDTLSEQLYGMSQSEAERQFVCISCKESMAGKLDETIHKKEYLLSGLCPSCFAEIAKER